MQPRKAPQRPQVEGQKAHQYRLPELREDLHFPQETDDPGRSIHTHHLRGARATALSFVSNSGAGGRDGQCIRPCLYGCVSAPPQASPRLARGAFTKLRAKDNFPLRIQSEATRSGSGGPARLAHAPRQQVSKIARDGGNDEGNAVDLVVVVGATAAKRRRWHAHWVGVTCLRPRDLATDTRGMWGPKSVRAAAPEPLEALIWRRFSVW